MISPTQEHLLAARLSFGPTPALCAALKERGLEAWLDEQLHPDEKVDADCETRMSKTRWPIEYGAGGDKGRSGLH